jgi:hypothetical protein
MDGSNRQAELRGRRVDEWMMTGDGLPGVSDHVTETGTVLL